MVWLPLVLLLVLVCFYLFLAAPRIPRREMPEGLRGVDYAHRGLWNANCPENSLAAFRRARATGFGIELDVHLTADDSLAVMHDDTAARMCNDSRRIEALTEREWRALRLPDGSGIPSFQEALEACGGAPLIVELKRGHRPAALCSYALAALRGYPGAWCIESFDPRVVRYLKKHAPEVFRGQLGYAGRGEKGLGRLLGTMVMNALGRPDFIAWRHEDDGCPAMRVQRALFRPHLVTWTVRSQQRMDALRGRYDLQIFEGFVPRRAAGKSDSHA